MAKVIGNIVGVPNPKSDWNQTDETKADYIRNKPDVYTKKEVDDKLSDIQASGGGGNAEPFVINLGLNPSRGDKTFDETSEAIKQGKEIVVNIAEYGIETPIINAMKTDSQITLWAVYGNAYIRIETYSDSSLGWSIDIEVFAFQSTVDSLSKQLGDIEKALLEIEAMADSLIGGDAE